MITVCEKCGDVGYSNLLKYCYDCKEAAVHLYCLEKIVYDGSLVDWFCYECRPIGVPHERQSQASQPIESTTEAGQGGNCANKSYKGASTFVERIGSTRMNSMERKHTRKNSNTKQKGKKANRRDHKSTNNGSKKANKRDHDITNNACTSREGFDHSCEAIGLGTAKASKENNQVGSEHFVPSNFAEKFNLPKEQRGSFCSSQDVEMPGPLVEDCLGDTIGTAKASNSEDHQVGSVHSVPLNFAEKFNLPKEQRGSFCSSQDVEMHAPLVEDCLGDKLEIAKASNSENHQVGSAVPSNFAEKFNLPKEQRGSFCSLQDVEMPAPLVEDCLGDTIGTAKASNTENHQVGSEHSVPSNFAEKFNLPKEQRVSCCSSQDVEMPAPLVDDCLGDTIGTANASNSENHQVGSEHSVLSNFAQKFILPKEQRGSFCSSQDVEMPAPLFEDCLGDTIGSLKQSGSFKAMNGLICKSKKAAKLKKKPTKRLFLPKRFKGLKSPKDGAGSRSKNTESSNPRNEQANSVPEIGNGIKNAVDRVMSSSANLDVLAKGNNYLPSKHIGINNQMDALAMVNNNLPSAHVWINNQKSIGVSPVLTGENQSVPSRLVDQTYSNSFKETSSKANIVLENSATAVGFSDTTEIFVKDNQRKRGRFILPYIDDDEEEAADVQKDFVNDNPRKRRRLVLPEDDEDNEEVAADVATEDFVKDKTKKRRKLILPNSDDDKEEEEADVPTKYSNPQSLGYDGSKNKNRVDTENHVDAVQRRNLKGQDLKNGKPVEKQEFVQDGEQVVQLDSLIPHSSEINWPVKKCRRYTGKHEDEEVIVSAENAKGVLNDVAQLASQTVVAKDQFLQSRIVFDLESANQQGYIYSQPIDEPVWSGTFKVNNEVSVKLAAHRSTKACHRVWELSSLLKPEVEVMKLHRSEAWPESWKTSGPTDESIGLFFFSHCMRPNEELDKLVEEIIDSDAVLKIVVDGADLLIFPSTLLPEQNHVFKGKHYLWGLFKRREDGSDKFVLSKERSGSACTAEEQEMQEHCFKEQCDSSDQEPSVMKHDVHVENQSPEPNCEVQAEAMKSGTREGLASPGNSSSAKPNSAAVNPKLINSTERVHGQPSSGQPITFFGFVDARTKRSQQLIQEMINEGALLFPVSEDMVITGSSTLGLDATAGNITGVEFDTTPSSKNAHKQECISSRCINFVSTGNDGPDGDSDACLELFPVQKEHIGWTPRVDAGKVDLDLSLRARSL